MHKYPQNESHVGSSGQTLSTNVSMTLCTWQFRHPCLMWPHHICTESNWVPNPYSPYARCGLDKGVAITRGGGGYRDPPTPKSPTNTGQSGALHPPFPGHKAPSRASSHKGWVCAAPQAQRALPPVSWLIDVYCACVLRERGSREPAKPYANKRAGPWVPPPGRPSLWVCRACPWEGGGGGLVCICFVHISNHWCLISHSDTALPLVGAMLHAPCQT